MCTQAEVRASFSALENAVTGLENAFTGLAANVEAMRTTQAQMLEISIDIQRRVSGASE